MTTTAPALKRIHHVAYRCNDAKETVEWYQRVLGMTYTTAFAEDKAPSTVRKHAMLAKAAAGVADPAQPRRNRPALFTLP